MRRRSTSDGTTHSFDVRDEEGFPVFIRAGTAMRYAFSIVAVALATLLRFLLDSALGPGVPFILYFPAVVLCAWFGGLWPGVLATALGGLIAWYVFIPVHYSFAFTSPTAPVELVVFVVAGVLISLLAESLHNARRNVEQSEAREREAREKLSVTLTSIGDAVITTDAGGRVSFMNRAAETLTGWKTAEAEGEPLESVLNIVNQDTRQPVESPALCAMREGIVVGLANPTVLIAKDGKEIPIDDSGAPIRDAEGRMLGAVLTFRDVTERRRAEAKFRLAIEASPSATVMADREGRIVLVNVQAERLFGYQRDELIGKPVELLVPERFRGRHPEYRHGFAIAPRARSMGGGRDLYGLCKDGREVPIEIGLNPIEIDGEPLVLSAIVDLTERKRAEHSLAEAARQQAALYRFAGRLQSAESLDGVYEAALDAMLDALGCDRASILLFDQTGVMRFVGWRGLSEAYRRAVEGHSPWTRDEADAQPLCEGDVAASALDDHLKTVLRVEGIGALAFIPLVTGGKLVGKFMTYYNAPHVFGEVEIQLSSSIARQLALGIERKKAAETLKSADRHKDEFLAMLSHELRNPLAALTTAARVLTVAPPGAGEATQAREIIARQAELMRHLIEDLLDVNRAVMGKMVLDRAPLDLAEVVSNVVDVWRSGGRMGDVRLSVNVSPVWIHADRIRMEQVFANLLDNAVKFTAAGGHVDVVVRQEGREAVLRVSDSGEGIAAELLEQVFDPFVQGRDRHRDRGGLGLGLALVKRLTELHGGSVEVSSAGRSRGATFIVRLNAVANPQTRVERPLLLEATSSRRILIVDDNDDMRRMLEALLALDGHRVVAARDGTKGLAMAAHSPPDVAVIDIGLPDIDGYEVARRLRAASPERRIGLIALTGFGQEEDQRRALAAGFDMHLTKPVTAEELSQAIARLV